MDSSGGNPEVYQNGRRYGMQLTPGSLSSPLSALVELSRILRGRHQHADIDSDGSFPRRHLRVHSENDQSLNERAEVSIRIIEAGESDSLQFGSGQDSLEFSSGHAVSLLRDAEDRDAQTSHVHIQDLVRSIGADNDSATGLHSSIADDTISSNIGGRGAVSHRYDFQQLTRWIEQVLPFIILLLMVFIRQHVQGFFVTFWISAVIVKANDLLRKQTALKGDRKRTVLLALSGVLLTHILVVYCLYKGADILRPLILVPPKYIPKFWQAIFIIIVNDTMVRQMAMVTKCFILIRFKNSQGRPYRQQGRLLTVVEYILLLYRALLPAPVWYRFFLNNDYGSLFSSLMTGLYLTFKLTATIEKVQRCFAAIKLLFRREAQYGSAATLEEVLAAGDLCAICQEKMHAPISLRCKHIFCEDCVTEWFERERTCPLCRAVVKSSSLKSFGDGSTSLFFQIF